MKQLDHQLDRLLRATAAGSASELPAEAPFHLEARVLADWRAAADGAEAGPLAFIGLIQKAFVCACAILLVAAALILHSRSEISSNELIDVDSAIQLTLLQ